MNHYTAYGLAIRSELDFPGLPTIDSVDTPADVVVRRGTVEPVPTSVVGEGQRRIRAEPQTCRLTYDGLGSIRVGEGAEIWIDPLSEDATVEFRRHIQNEVLGILIHQRGLLTLHASAVSVAGRAAVFLGPPQAGKSTTAAAFHTQGYPLLEDDVVGIHFENDTPTVVPGVPQFRLLSDAVDALDVEATSLPVPTAETGSTKCYRRVEAVPDPVPLAGCYLLRDAETLSLDSLPPRKRLFELISKTYTAGLLSDTEATSAHFQQCAEVAETTPFRILRRPDDHQQLPSLVELVVDDLRSSV
ncbi:hypothetical protein OB955_19370 [Halobacteria archaeon AArc-m2/3/4]|uniref:Hpr(Ser) kinase/phosphatase n=1 Tax=Natronoglomus mannanivorans TaxID=2979990 RepID=A0ABT2QIX1_9EURY|nr:hypothetical protein [Halobacteria archaeon AArc-m2/3/4]